MTLEINIDLVKLQATALLAAKNDIRHYLNAVYVEATATCTRLAATNGHYAGMHARAIPDGFANKCDFETVLIPLDVIAQCKPAKGMPNIGTVLIDEGKYSMRLWTGTLIPFSAIEGKFPDIRRIVPSGPASGEATNFNAEYLAVFAKVNKMLGAAHPGQLELGQRGDQKVITIKVLDTDFVGVLMGLRATDTHHTVEPWPAAGPDPIPEVESFQEQVA